MSGKNSKYRPMSRNLRTRKNNGETFRAFLFFSLFVGMLFSSLLSPSHAVVSLKNLNNDYLTLHPSFGNFDTEGIKEKVSPFLLNFGGFPSKGSDLESTYYGLLANSLLNSTEQLSTEEKEKVYEFVLSLFDEETGGFQETALQTLTNYYYALNIIDLLGESIPNSVSENLSSFLSQYVVNNSYFVDSPGSYEISPYINLYALRLISLIEKDVGDYINPASLTQILVEKYRSSYVSSVSSFYPLFMESSSTILKTTYAISSILRSLNTFYSYYPELNQSWFTPIEGVLIEGDNSSLSMIDNNSLNIESTAEGSISLEILIPLDLLGNYYSEDKISLGFYFNNSRDTISSLMATFSLYNPTVDQWDDQFVNVSLGDSSLTLEDNYTLWTCSSLSLNYTNYTLIGTESDSKLPYLKARVTFYNSSFSNELLSIEKFYYSYCMVNGESVLSDVLSRFNGIRFDPDSLSENYYGSRFVIEFASRSDLLDSQWEMLAKYITLFTSDTGGFYEKTSDLFDSIKFVYFAAYIFSIDANGELSNYSLYDTDYSRLISSYIRKWMFSDGGFGSYSSLSLKATYHALSLLNLSGSINSTIAQEVSSYLDKCHAYGAAVFYNDYNEEDSSLTDSYYAIQIRKLLDPSYDISNDEMIIETLIANQDPVGYFMGRMNIKDIYYCLSLLNEGNAIDQLPYRSALENYIISLQLYYGGFLPNPNEVEATVEATVYGVESVKILDIVGSINLVEENNKLGVIEYYANHQDPQSGGFYEESFGFLSEESQKNAQLELTYDVIHSVYDFQNFAELNGTGISGYIVSNLYIFNTFAQCDSENRTQMKDFYYDLSSAYYSYESYMLLLQAGLNMDVKVHRETVFPGSNVAFQVDVKDKNGNLIEGAEIYIETRGLTYSLTDNQNGSYTGKIYYFDSPGTYVIKISCKHDDYFDIAMEYLLEIYQPIDMKKLYDARTEVGLFSNRFTYKVSIINESSEQPIEDCEVSLIDDNESIIYSLSYDNETGKYTAPINMSIWIPQTYHYYLSVEGGMVRPEIFEVSIIILPFMLLVYIAGAIAAILSVLMKTSPTFREKVFQKMEKIRGVMTESDKRKKAKKEEKKEKLHKEVKKEKVSKISKPAAAIDEKALIDKDIEYRKKLGEAVYEKFKDFDIETRLKIFEKLENLPLKVEQKKEDNDRTLV